MMKRNFLFILFLFAVLTMFVSPAQTFAANQVVTDCTNDVELRAALTAMQSSGGGTLTFNCGVKTIALASPLPDITSVVTIDGGNKITLSGEDAVSLFWVRPDATLVLKNIVLTRGYNATTFGGAILNEGFLTLHHTTIQFSHTLHDGGAIANFRSLEIIGSTFRNNFAQNGGAIYGDTLSGSSQLKITSTIFESNRADYSGGAILTNTPFEINQGLFVDNRSPLNGGAIYARSQNKTSSIKDSTFRENLTTADEDIANGGALLVEDTTVNIQDTLLDGNRARQGGGIYVMPAGKVSVINSTFSNQFTLYGGGIYNKGTTMLSSVTLWNNIAFGSGGGIENYGDLSLTNVTISGNDSLVSAGLGNYNGTASLTNVTFADNSTGEGGVGGILNAGATTVLYLKNVVLNKAPKIDQDPGANCYFEQPPTISESNLSDDASCNFGTGRDNIDLKLGELAENGGVTKTHLPKVGSPAIDGGANDNCPATDQRGITRPQGTLCDVGAVEVKQSTPTPTSTPPACSGAPSKPVLVKPGNTKKAKGPAVKLDWDDTRCAESFKVIVRLGSPTGAKVQQKGGLTQSEFTTKSLTKGQTYAWRVIAINSARNNKSAWWTFQIK